MRQRPNFANQPCSATDICCELIFFLMGMGGRYLLCYRDRIYLSWMTYFGLPFLASTFNSLLTSALNQSRGVYFSTWRRTDALIGALPASFPAYAFTSLTDRLAKHSLGKHTSLAKYLSTRRKQARGDTESPNTPWMRRTQSSDSSSRSSQMRGNCLSKKWRVLLMNMRHTHSNSCWRKEEKQERQQEDLSWREEVRGSPPPSARRQGNFMRREQRRLSLNNGQGNRRKSKGRVKWKQWERPTCLRLSQKESTFSQKSIMGRIPNCFKASCMVIILFEVLVIIDGQAQAEGAEGFGRGGGDSREGGRGEGGEDGGALHTLGSKEGVLLPRQQWERRSVHIALLTVQVWTHCRKVCCLPARDCTCQSAKVPPRLRPRCYPRPRRRAEASGEGWHPHHHNLSQIAQEEVLRYDCDRVGLLQH